MEGHCGGHPVEGHCGGHTVEGHCGGSLWRVTVEGHCGGSLWRVTVEDTLCLKCPHSATIPQLQAAALHVQ